MRPITEQDKQRIQQEIERQALEVHPIHPTEPDLWVALRAELVSDMTKGAEIALAALSSSIPSDLLDRMREALESVKCDAYAHTAWGFDVCPACSGTGQKHHLLLKELKEYQQ